MSFKQRVLGSFVSFIIATTAFAAEGAGRGGADLPDYSRSAAWFLGTKPVHYCIQVAPNFGFNETDLQKQIEKTFEAWRTYVQIKGVNKGRPAEDALVMNLAAPTTCDGTEDMRFYFGVDAPEVLKASEGLERPLAFAYHEDYDFDQGWIKGKAFVWLAGPTSVFPNQSFPDWTNPGLISAILLHEAGHIFGNEHVLGTIMDPGLGEKLQEAFASGSSGVYVPGKNGASDQHVKGDQPWMHRIDDKVELWSCEECQKKGKISGSPKEAAQLFEKFIGKSPVGIPQIAASLRNSVITVSFCDDKGCVPANVRFKNNQAGSWSVIEISQNSFVVSRSKGGGMGRHLEAGTGYFQVQDRWGAWVSMTLDFNLQTSSSSSPFQLKYFHGGAQRVDLMNWEPLN